MIRAEKEKDCDAVYNVNERAFETSAEAKLVDILRAQADPVISLVCEENLEIVGHIMFSPVILSGHPELKLMGLAPMAVAPEHQCKGFGSALVMAGLEQCRQLSYAVVVVLGHPLFYPRFGFSPASGFGIKSEYKVADEVFMAIELQSEILSAKTGTIKYHAAFSSV
ncbi:MAG: N-acetyltransferase [Deltaproteobacteria bacterium]|jgi:putative acetyltransferase|nr:N-acetyltransferase [Deltaproteobacteria bacterium]